MLLMVPLPKEESEQCLLNITGEEGYFASLLSSAKEFLGFQFMTSAKGVLLIPSNSELF